MRIGRHWTRAATPAAAALCALLLAGTGSAARGVIEIQASDAEQHAGEVATVCGKVASTAYLASVAGRPTFLNFERPYPDQVFTVVIWGSNRDLFDGRPENLFDGRSVCVTGEIVVHKGRPEIIVESPDQIVVTASAGKSELGDFETVFVKAVLAGLGYDTDYGTGEWDEAAVAAMTAFQADAGVDATGEPDPRTLRALADAAVEMPEADSELIVRLLLFELARRQE